MSSSYVYLEWYEDTTSDLRIIISARLHGSRLRARCSFGIGPNQSHDSRAFEEPCDHALLLRQGQRFFFAGADRTAARGDVSADRHRGSRGGRTGFRPDFGVIGRGVWREGVGGGGVG